MSIRLTSWRQNLPHPQSHHPHLHPWKVASEKKNEQELETEIRFRLENHSSVLCCVVESSVLLFVPGDSAKFESSVNQVVTSPPYLSHP